MYCSKLKVSILSANSIELGALSFSITIGGREGEANISA